MPKLYYVKKIFFLFWVGKFVNISNKEVFTSLKKESVKFSA